MSDEELIHAHKDSWSTRELMGKILSRHCHVLEDIEEECLLISRREAR